MNKNELNNREKLIHLLSEERKFTPVENAVKEATIHYLQNCTSFEEFNQDVNNLECLEYLSTEGHYDEFVNGVVNNLSKFCNEYGITVEEYSAEEEDKSSLLKKAAIGAGGLALAGGGYLLARKFLKKGIKPGSSSTSKIAEQGKGHAVFKHKPVSGDDVKNVKKWSTTPKGKSSTTSAKPTETPKVANQTAQNVKNLDEVLMKNPAYREAYNKAQILKENASKRSLTKKENKELNKLRDIMNKIKKQTSNS